MGDTRIFDIMTIQSMLRCGVDGEAGRKLGVGMQKMPQLLVVSRTAEGIALGTWIFSWKEGARDEQSQKSDP